MNTLMRAKLKCTSVTPSSEGEALRFVAVGKSGAYPSDGRDEDNSYARWTPSAELSINIQNPALKGKIAVGDTFYVDFTPVSK